jgi:hypothetical protein
MLTTFILVFLTLLKFIIERLMSKKPIEIAVSAIIEDLNNFSIKIY